MDAMRTSEEYQKGVEEFIEFAKRNVWKVPVPLCEVCECMLIAKVLTL